MLALTSDIATWAHRWPAGAKLLALAVASVVLYAAPAPLAVLGGGVALSVALYLSGGMVFARKGVRSLRGVMVLALILGAWMGWTRGFETGLLHAGRLLVAVALANFVTLTTRLDAMSAVFMQLLGWLGLPAPLRRRIALALALAIRFVPVLSERAGRLHLAWRARSGKRAGVALIMPMVVSAIDEAEQVAEALRARGGV